MDSRLLRRHERAGLRVDACVGQQLGGPRRRRYPGPRTIISRACFSTSIRSGALSTRAEASEDASFTSPIQPNSSRLTGAATRCVLSAAVTAEVQLENKRTVP